MTALQRLSASDVLIRMPVIAVLRARHAREYERVIEALAAGGIRSIELTLSTNGVVDELPRLLERFGPELEIGVGTVLDVEQAQLCMDSGANYLVTPNSNIPVARAAVERRVPVFPGGLTPTELLSGWQSGATAVKIFPASVVGPDYLMQLRGPFPDMLAVPSGGIAVDDALDWLDAGALAVSIGGPLLQDAFSGGSLKTLQGRAADLTHRVEERRSAQPGGGRKG